MSALNMMAGWQAVGDIVMMEQMPIFGGYVGGVEETAICDVATMIASFAIFDCDIHLDGPIHIRWGTTTTRETLKIAAHAAAALDQNTDFLLANQYYTMAGPCTEMCLLEIAAQAMTDTASGRELLSGVASSKGVSRDRTTGMEARFMGEVSLATCGMSIEDVNFTIDNVLKLYEKDFAKAPQGKTFQECYDVTTMEPSDEYVELYDRMVDVLGTCGMDFRSLLVLLGHQVEAGDPCHDHEEADPADPVQALVHPYHADHDGTDRADGRPYRVARTGGEAVPESEVEQVHAYAQEDQHGDHPEGLGEPVGELQAGRPCGLRDAPCEDVEPSSVHRTIPLESSRPTTPARMRPTSTIFTAPTVSLYRKYPTAMVHTAPMPVHMA